MKKLALAFAALFAVAVVPMVTSAAPSTPSHGASDRRGLDPKAPHELVLPAHVRRTVGSSLASLRRMSAAPVVGDERIWVGSDETRGDYLKAFTLRGIGDHIEVWVASDRDKVSGGTNFPPGDCRNGGVGHKVATELLAQLL